ncbi:TadE/TadG family type IV pilus assembly protein [Vallitalea okinawensis]|uniref:TadE/TadG family type IV pilus assembly protein n=1 Tax=Vallitalea okinawensis TaxID=2078660 RepID=UPI000CFAA27C|nr:TadE/TadG family type IV pilus assembly protein [Vallitalea okinawensis]
MNHHKKKISGSLTLEAAIILPIVIVILLFLIALCLMQYKKVYLQGLVNRVTRQEAHNYKSVMGQHLYWRIYDHKKSDKLDEIRDYIEAENVFMKEGTTIEVQLETGLIGDYLNVHIQTPFNFGVIPLGFIQVSSRSSVKDTTEMIRNFQLIDDYAAKLPAYDMMKKKWEAVINQVVEQIAFEY